VTLCFEMGFAPAEFHRLLPTVAKVEYDAALNRFSHLEEGRHWSLRLINPRERVIGLLHLPLVDVELRFEGYTQPDIEALVARFKAHFRRGGG
jgi:hypothetical protein